MRALLPPLAALVFLAATAGPAAQTSRAGPPVAVFTMLDGTWSGRFIGLDPEGRELFGLTARHTYRTISDTEQEVEIRDVMDDGTVITGRGVNSAVRGPDGRLVLKCVVEKSDGQTVNHDGRLIRGPEGDEQIVWYSRSANGTETFRELVRVEGERTFYEINGMGRYGDSLILMTGRYQKIDE